MPILSARIFYKFFGGKIENLNSVQEDNNLDKKIYTTLIHIIDKICKETLQEIWQVLQ